MKTEPTMRYRPNKVAGATASEKKPVYYYKVFEGDEVESCLDDGWYVHPDEFPKKKAEPKVKPKEKAGKGKK